MCVCRGWRALGEDGGTSEKITSMGHQMKGPLHAGVDKSKINNPSSGVAAHGFVHVMNVCMD